MMADRREELEKEERRAELVSFGDRDRERTGSETRAEVAREFRKTLNRNRPSRKRYSLASSHQGRQQVSATNTLDASSSGQQFETSIADGSSYRGLSKTLPSDGNPFAASSGGDDAYNGGIPLPLTNLEGGEAIYREFEEYESLSKLKNGLRKTFPQPIRKSLLPPRSWKEWRRFVFVHLPIIRWLWAYRTSNLIGDLIAGVTIGVTHIPQGPPIK